MNNDLQRTHHRQRLKAVGQLYLHLSSNPDVADEILQATLSRDHMRFRNAFRHLPLPPELSSSDCDVITTTIIETMLEAWGNVNICFALTPEADALLQRVAAPRRKGRLDPPPPPSVLVYQVDQQDLRGNPPPNAVGDGYISVNREGEILINLLSEKGMIACPRMTIVIRDEQTIRYPLFEFVCPPSDNPLGPVVTSGTAEQPL